jgi:hypothetical protein
MARYVKDEKVTDILDISNGSESDIWSESDNYDFHFSGDSDFIPCTPPVTPMPEVTVTRHIIHSSSESDEWDKEIIIMHDDETDWEEVASQGNTQPKQTTVYQETEAKNMHLPQNARLVAYFYLLFTPIFQNIIVTETNRYAQRQKHTNRS